MAYLSADPLLRRVDLDSTRSGAVPGWPGIPPGAQLLESGRIALWAALRALGFKTDDRLVVPAYICDSILPAPAALRVEVRYIATDRQLRPDLEAIERELKDLVGRDLAEDPVGRAVGRWLRKSPVRRGLDRVVEDVTDRALRALVS